MLITTNTSPYPATAAPVATVSTWQKVGAGFGLDYFSPLTGRRAR